MKSVNVVENIIKEFLVKSFITFSVLFTSLSTFAIESGSFSYVNLDTKFSPMYSSLVIDTASCEEGGAIVTFEGLQPRNFCLGSKSRKVQTYTKCIGKEISYYPIRLICIGTNKSVEFVTETSVYLNERGELVETEIAIDDGKKRYESSFSLKEIENGDLIVTHKYKNYKVKESQIKVTEFFFKKD